MHLFIGVSSPACQHAHICMHDARSPRQPAGRSSCQPVTCSAPNAITSWHQLARALQEESNLQRSLVFLLPEPPRLEPRQSRSGLWFRNERPETSSASDTPPGVVCSHGARGPLFQESESGKGRHPREIMMIPKLSLRIPTPPLSPLLHHRFTIVPSKAITIVTANGLLRETREGI